MRIHLRLSALCLVLGCRLAGGSPAADGVLLDETFSNNQAGWLIDSFSKVVDGTYQIDARGEGGYYRWLAKPSDLGDFALRVEVRKIRGNNQRPLFGVIFRVQESWKNCYFLVVNGSSGYFFGKFVQGSAVILKQGTEAALKPAGGLNTLVVRASGNAFGLAANNTPVANVIDDSFRTGRVGLFVEAPAMVQFDNLRVTSLAGEAGAASAELPPSGVKVLFEDDFSRNTGWATDEFRTLDHGRLLLHNQGEHRSFLSWNPATGGYTDFVAQADASLLKGDGKVLYGLCWRVRDGDHFYFFLVSAAGGYYAGVRNGDDIQVLRKGHQPAVRTMPQANTLEVRSAGREFKLKINGEPTCSFQDDRLPRGAFGFYLEQPGEVAFDDLTITDLPENAPPTPGAGPHRWPVGSSRLQHPLQQNVEGFAWPVDAEHRFEAGGYCLTAPAKGSRTAAHEATRTLTDGVFMVNARPLNGPLQSGYGLLVRGNAALDSFLFLTLNAAGRYFVGVCTQGRFNVVDSGQVQNLRGGDQGNELQLTVEGPVIRYGINDQLLGNYRDETLQQGAVGLYVENGVTACFRDLRVYNLPRE